MLSLTLRERWLNVMQSRMCFDTDHWPLVAARTGPDQWMKQETLFSLILISQVSH